MRKVANVKIDDTNAVRLMICNKNKEGVFVFGYNTFQDTSCYWDTHMDSMEEAYEFGEDYGIKREDWLDIGATKTNCQDDWIYPVRIKRTSLNKPDWGNFDILNGDKWEPIPTEEQKELFEYSFSFNDSTIIDFSCWMDGGSVEIIGNNKTNGDFKIEIMQHLSLNYPPFINTPGRIYFNEQKVAVRSEFESKIIQYLRTITSHKTIDGDILRDKIEYLTSKKYVSNSQKTKLSTITLN